MARSPGADRAPGVRNGDGILLFQGVGFEHPEWCQLKSMFPCRVAIFDFSSAAVPKRHQFRA